MGGWGSKWGKVEGWDTGGMGGREDDRRLGAEEVHP